VSDAPNIAQLRPRDRTGAERQKRFRKRKRDAAVTVTANPTAPIAVTPAPRVTRNGTDLAAFGAALALTSTSGYFGIVGMTAIFTAAAGAVTAITTVLEGSKLAAAAWLARNWRTAPLLLRLLLAAMVLGLMVVTTIGSAGFLVRAHVTHFASERKAINASAVPIAQHILVAEAAVSDLEARVKQLDGMITSATAHDRTRSAMSLLADQSKMRADLIAKRQAAAEQLGAL
jgi:hypothetical protein